MLSLKLPRCSFDAPFLPGPPRIHKLSTSIAAFREDVAGKRKQRREKAFLRRCQAEEKKGDRRTFLTPEEAGLVEMTGLSTHERFLCRLTVSSLNLLRVIAEQEGCSIEELNAGRVCDWFIKDRVKREQNIESAVLQWDDSDFQI